MERIAHLHIEGLPDLLLATCDDIPGLVAHERTDTQTLDVARDIARKLIEAQSGRPDEVRPADVADTFGYPVVMG